MKIVIIFMLILFIIIYMVVNFAFKKTILAKRKDRETMFNILRNTNAYTEDKFNSLKIENLEITSDDNYNLRDYYINKFKESKKLIIIVHGYTANHYRSAQYIDMFLKKEFNVLLIDVRSHGNSEGTYATYGKKEIEDLDLWVNFMREKIGQDAFIGIHGHSMGAATVLMYSEIGENKVQFIISESPYSTGKDIIRYQFKKANTPFFIIYRLVDKKIKKTCGFSMGDISPMDAVKKSNIPTMFVHGDKDEKIPYTMTVDMYNMKKGKKKLFIVEGADHIQCYSINKKTYEKEIYEFLEMI